MSNEKLTFGELCEAIANGKALEYRYADNIWKDYASSHTIMFCGLLFEHKRYDFRIKTKKVKRYQWVCKHPGRANTFWIMGDEKKKYTKEEAENYIRENKMMSVLIEPYLPSEASE